MALRKVAKQGETGRVQKDPPPLKAAPDPLMDDLPGAEDDAEGFEDPFPPGSEAEDRRERGEQFARDLEKDLKEELAAQGHPNVNLSVSTEDFQGIDDRILQVMQEVEYIQKREATAQLKYATIAYNDVLKQIRPAMIRAGLTLVPGEVQKMEFRSVKTKNGDWTVCDMVQSFSLRCYGASVPLVASGSGADSMDKAVVKAQTMTRKNALLSLFLVETGEEHPDDRQEPLDASGAAAAVRYISGEDVRDLTKLMKDAQFTEAKLCEAYGVGSIRDLTEDQIPEVFARLEKRLEAIQSQRGAA